jgi:hypothetical protein
MVCARFEDDCAKRRSCGIKASKRWLSTMNAL